MMITGDPIERWIAANGIEHHVLEWNEEGRDTVVLCHGFLDIAWSWVEVAVRLAAAGMRVVAFDWRGHGESSWVGSGGYYHFPDYLLDLDELLPRVCPGHKPHLVGHSMGANVAALYAGCRGERLRTLTLVEGLGLRDRPEHLFPGRFSAWLEGVRSARQRAPTPMACADEAYGRMRAHNPALGPELGLFLARKGTRPGPDGHGLVWRFDPLHRTPSPAPMSTSAFLAFLERIPVLTLVVLAEHGFRLPDEHERLARIPRSTSLTVDGVGHMVHQLAAAVLAPALFEHVTKSRDATDSR